MSTLRFPLTYTALLTVSLLGCGGGGGSTPIANPPLPPPAPAPTGLLITPPDEQAFVDAFRRSLAPGLAFMVEEGQAGNPSLLAPPVGDADSGAFSTTYRLEADVDEHDVVKYDGERLFIAPTRGGACCFPVEPLAAGLDLLLPPPPEGPRRIRILGTNPNAATAESLGSIELEGDQAVEGLYINDHTLTAITSTAWWGSHGESFTNYLAWESQTLSLRLYDVSNPSNASAQWSLELDGALVATRQIGNRVFMVSRHYPALPELDYNATDAETQAANQAVLDSLSASDLLPKLRIDGELIDEAVGFDSCLLVDPQHPAAPDSPGYPVLTTLLIVDVASRSLDDVVCYAEPTDGVYLSSSAAYLAQSVYDNPDAVDSIVHRFDLDAGFTYRGSARIAGSLSGRGQVDFRMSERDDVLRLVTTRWRNDEEDRFDHRLYTLAPAENEPSLSVLAQLPESGDSTPIGKPNENLFGVRFIADRAYLVTFEQIDPLYVIDLSDPTRPEILGELEVSGFSDLLHPVSEHLLLGLGDDGEGRIKLELFDISDPAAPRSRSTILLAADAAWSWTEARYDRRAFSYLPATDSPDRFTVPVSFALETVAGFEQREQLVMLEVRDKTEPASATLAAVGVLEAVADEYVESRPRSVIDGNAVYFVLGDQVWSGYWGSEGATLGPF